MRRRGAWISVLRLDLRLLWRSTLAWVVVFAVAAGAIPSAYRSAYPTAASRAALAKLLEGNHAFEALNGLARGVDTPGGFAAWRIGTSLAVVAAIWMLVASTRLLRGEEESGRWEHVIGGAVGPAGATAAALVALGLALVVLWLATTGAFAGAGLDLRGSALIAAGIAGAGAAFAAVGAIAAQLVSLRRRAAGLAGAVLAVAFLLRVLADGTETLGWLRPLTPFGWIEDLRPFAGSDLVWLVPLAAWVAAFSVVALALAARRDLGAGTLLRDDVARSSGRLLGSAPAFATRTSIAPAVVWTLGVGAFGAVFGLLARDVAVLAARSPGFQRFAGRLGGVDLGTAQGFLGIAFTVLVVPVSLYAGFRLSAAREEEAAGRLDNVLVRAVGRREWILSQAGVALAGAAAVAAGTALLTWVAAASRGAGVSFAGMLVGAANCLPVTVLFIGIGVLSLAVVPRAAPAITLGAIASTYLLQLIGALAKLPDLVLDLSPFRHVAPAPGAPVDTGAAVVMTAIGLACVAAGTELFARRDLAGE